ncbi:pre-tRNA nuclear export protein [Coemansia javaensis]|uniref:Exportin-T n=1 Tax=Coemansia javaensis TaxID=2761396 RepID=A0A9W8LK27_9FUNG|nr:pre-tRNA nuclear export protein [Coemansia javaensis]
MEQVVEAVRCALDPESAPDVKAQATQYCEQVKRSPDGWRLCLELFTGAPERAPEVRLFALQAVEAMIGDAGVRGAAPGAAERLGTVRKVLLGFVAAQYGGARYGSEPAFIKNTLAHTMAVLGLATYPAQWPTFVRDMVALAGAPEGAGAGGEDGGAGAGAGAISPGLADFLVRVLGALDEEMVSRVVPRSAEEAARNTAAKDAMRVADVGHMAHAWHAILLRLGATHPDLCAGVLRLVGAYVAWIDINLVVNQPFMRTLFGLLRAPALRCAACQCLVKIVAKGMPPAEKLRLLQFLDVVAIMRQLDAAAAADAEFGEAVGQLANATAIELSAIWAEKDAAETRAAAAAMLEDLQPLLLTFLSHERSEVSSSVFHAVNDILAALKKTQQRDGAPLTAFQHAFLAKLLPILVDRLQYRSDYPWPSPAAAAAAAAAADHDGSLDEDDDEAMFGGLRHSLRVFIDAIGQIAPDLYDGVIVAAARAIFKQCAQYGVSSERAADEGGKGRGQLGWVRAELGIYLTQAYGERLSSSKGLRFTAAKHAAAGQPPPADSLRDLLTLMIQSGVIRSTHPSAAPVFFENVVRFGGYFEVQREAVAPVLAAFLGPTGVAHPYGSVRPRIWYLLHRFVKQLPSSSGLAGYARDFVSAVGGLLRIRADPAAAAAAATATAAATAAATATATATAGDRGGGYGLFDSQLYLFEACGMVLAPAGLDDAARMAALQHLFDPLFSGAQQAMNARPADQILQDPQALLQIHHYLTAIGSIVKGFPDVRVDPKTASASAPSQLSPSTVQVFLKAADMCIAILEALHASQLIREAARFSLSRMLSVLGAEALPYLSRLIHGLVGSCAVEELVDLLGLLGQVAFKFKPHVAPTASELLLPVISKVYGFLDQVAQNGAAGTDEAVLLQELRKGYLLWVAALFNSDLDGIFLAPPNAPHLITIFRPIATQLAVDASSPQCQRLAFSVLFKALQAWLVDPLGWHTLATLTPSAAAAAATATAKDARPPPLRQAAARALGLALDGAGAKEARAQFRQFAMDTALPACFEAPARPGFRAADAQASLVLSEIAGVLQMALLSGAPEIAGDDGSAVAAMAPPQLLATPLGGDLNRNQCASYMSTALLPEMGCPPPMAAEFVQAVASLDQKQLKKYLVSFLAGGAGGGR